MKQKLLLKKRCKTILIIYIFLFFLHFSFFFSRFGKRVSRAFSFNKTPSRLKRAISSVTHKGFSPFVRDNAVTPGDLKGRRLASTFDLTVSL